MYLKGSKWSMMRRHRRINYWLVTFLVVMVGMFVYVDLVIIPTTPPLFVPTPTPTRDPRSYAQDAASLYAAGKISQAMDSYKQAILADPQNPDNYITLARLQVFAGEYKDAQTNAEDAILLNKNSALAHAVRGWALGMQDSYLEAEAAINQAITLDAKSALTHAYYAEILSREGDETKIGNMDKAASESRLALQLDPNIVETHRARGIVLEATGNYQEAIPEFEAAIKINDKIADLHLSLGRNYINITNYANAVTEFTKAYALNPNDPWPNYYISRTYMRTGDRAKAIQYAELAVKDGPSDPWMEGNLGSQYYANGQYDKAILYLRLFVRGGTTSDGIEVKGVPLSDDQRVLEFFARYGLALAKTNQCNEAVQIAQGILNNVKDETAVANAQIMITTCQENITGTSTPTVGSGSGTKPAVTPTS
jgi:tetratricopeptide (TPR) repeat protein